MLENFQLSFLTVGDCRNFVHSCLPFLRRHVSPVQSWIQMYYDQPMHEKIVSIGGLN